MQRIMKDLVKHMQQANGMMVLRTNSKIWNKNLQAQAFLTLSAPHDVTNIIKTKSTIRVWVGVVHI